MNEDAMLLAGLLDRMPSGMAQIDAGGRVLRANPRLGALLGIASPPAGARLADWLGEVAALGRLSQPRGLPALEASLAEASGTARWQLREGGLLDVAVHGLPDGTRLCLWTEAPGEDRRPDGLLLEGTHDLVVLTGADGRILASSSRGGTMFGLPAALLVPGADRRGLLRALQPGGDPGAAASDGELLEGLRAPPAALPATRRMPDGRWAELSLVPSEEGRLLIGLRDVTALKEAQLALERERETLRLVVDNMSDGVMLFDEEMRWRMLSPPLMKFLDLPERFNRLGTHARDVFEWQMRRGDYGPPPEDPEEFAEALESRLANLRQAGGTRYTREMSTGYWLDARVQHLPNGGMLAFYRDVTDLKQQEAQIEAERSLLRQVLNSMQEMVVLFDAETRILLSNGWGRNLLDLPEALVLPGALMSEAMNYMYRRGDFGFDLTAEEVVGGRVSSILSGPVSFTRQTAGGKWVEFSYTPISEGRIMAVGRDVTSLKESERAAIAARDAAEEGARAKASFLAAMSHEIRTPMNGVLGMLEILARGELRPDQARSVEVMRESAESLLRIVDDLLDFSKIEAGRLEIEAAPFSLRGLVEGAVETLVPTAAARGLTLFLDPLGAGPDWLSGDPTRVRQVLFNLIGNAVKFTERGYVRVSAGTRTEEGPGGEVAVLTVLVEDSGIGMDAGTLTRLFEPFTQADSTTTRRFGGTGLGLSIVRRLAQAMGGEVTAESEVGRGSRFTVTLRLGVAAPPAASVLSGPPETEPAHRLGQAAERRGVLVVDDHPVNREVLGRQLELLGLQAAMAEGGGEALALWRAQAHDILLLDIHMPGMDGFELARAIRQEEEVRGLPRTPLIAVTASVLKGEAERCYAAGMDGFLAKPVTLEGLSRILGRWLSQLPGAPQGGNLFDPEALRGLFGQDRARLAAILESFSAAASRDLAALREARDPAQVAEIAHRLKGAAQMVGARLLAEQAQGVEDAAQEGRLEAALPAAARLPGLLEETMRVARPALGSA